MPGECKGFVGVGTARRALRSYTKANSRSVSWTKQDTVRELLEDTSRQHGEVVGSAHHSFALFLGDEHGCGAGSSSALQPQCGNSLHCRVPCPCISKLVWYSLGNNVLYSSIYARRASWRTEQLSVIAAAVVFRVLYPTYHAQLLLQLAYQGGILMLRRTRVVFVLGLGQPEYIPILLRIHEGIG